MSLSLSSHKHQELSVFSTQVILTGIKTVWEGNGDSEMSVGIAEAIFLRWRSSLEGTQYSIIQRLTTIVFSRILMCKTCSASEVFTEITAIIYLCLFRFLQQGSKILEYKTLTLKIV
uniref:Uncharacterized protein n=1 Tax=Physcomitrium patens TaxID=3218 RepID=A0A2K1JVQ5_PHYPA|nr:hypothetical protein PHYPA_015374 [Physcomitrium patens]